MIKQIILRWLNKFQERAENDYRMANIAGVIESEDKILIKKFRVKMKILNEKFGVTK
jgi:hypothetical protein